MLIFNVPCDWYTNMSLPSSFSLKLYIDTCVLHLVQLHFLKMEFPIVNFLCQVHELADPTCTLIHVHVGSCMHEPWVGIYSQPVCYNQEVVSLDRKWVSLGRVRVLPNTSSKGGLNFIRERAQCTSSMTVEGSNSFSIPYFPVTLPLSQIW